MTEPEEAIFLTKSEIIKMLAVCSGALMEEGRLKVVHNRDKVESVSNKLEQAIQRIEAEEEA